MAFNAIQREQAVTDYHSLALSNLELVKDIAPRLMKVIEFRTYAAIFDLSVQQGTIDKNDTLEYTSTCRAREAVLPA